MFCFIYQVNEMLYQGKWMEMLYYNIFIIFIFIS